MIEAAVGGGPRSRPWGLIACLSGVAAAVVITAVVIGWPSPVAVTRIVPATPARLVLEQGLVVLDSTLGALGAELDGARTHQIRSAFRDARIAYKRVECLLTVFGPTLAAELNGPLPEDEDRPAPQLGAPAGFQVIEAASFGGKSPGRDSLRATVAVMRQAVSSFRPLLRYVSISEPMVLDAIRLELARVEVLGLAGVDADLSGDGVLESAEALEGARGLVEAAPRRYEEIDSLLARAAKYLRAQPQFDSMNRIQFIVGYANPAARAVAAARALLPGPRPLRRLWRQSAATLFDAGAFDPTAYAPDYAPQPSAALIGLGHQLFLEPKLSGPGTRSCAFCHDPTRAFADGRPRSNVLVPAPNPPRNTPTLLEAGYQPALFADSRAGSLEIQAGSVLASPSEMGGSAELAATRLRDDRRYHEAFIQVFGGDSAVSGRNVRVALAAYVRSLGPLGAPLDRALRGDTLALTAAERRGFTIFMGKGRCGTCHFVPLFNGTLPPDYVVSEPEIIGVPVHPEHRGARLDPDPGRGGFDHEPRHQAAFKVPTLRNVALTAPYMHNGAFATLDQVIDFYDRGGGAGTGALVPDQTLPARPLHLTAQEKGDLLALLKALTDN